MNKLRAARKVAGLSMKEAAEASHTPYRTWQGWEDGSRRVPGIALAWIELYKHTKEKTTMFINYDKNTGLSIDSFRNPSATVGDITDLVAAVKTEDESITCQLEGAKDALEDGSIWQDDDQEALEEVHDFIARFEK
jgi:transcriptional regulator with XRE-family HTH domain